MKKTKYVSIIMDNYKRGNRKILKNVIWFYNNASLINKKLKKYISSMNKYKGGTSCK